MNFSSLTRVVLWKSSNNMVEDDFITLHGVFER